MGLRATGTRLQALVEKVSAEWQRVARLRSEPRASSPPRASVGGPLDAINDEFHDTYGVARNEARHEAPVFVVLADELIVFHRDTRIASSFAPVTFHIIKSVSHAPLAIFATFQRLEGKTLDATGREHLAEQRKLLGDSLERLARDAGELPASTQRDLRTVLQACVDFLDPPRSSASEENLAAFAGALGPVLLRLADDATQLQLDALHKHVERALGTLTAEDLARLHVVVAGDHQARARSLAMQYFQKRLGEPEQVERRVTYAEGVSDEQGALALVGTRRLDRALGRAFFGEEQRLQRDILGDAAHARLKAFELAPIG
jgi:hypothetical protein